MSIYIESYSTKATNKALMVAHQPLQLLCLGLVTFDAIGCFFFYGK